MFSFVFNRLIYDSRFFANIPLSSSKPNKRCNEIE